MCRYGDKIDTIILSNYSLTNGCILVEVAIRSPPIMTVGNDGQQTLNAPRSPRVLYRMSAETNLSRSGQQHVGKTSGVLTDPAAQGDPNWIFL